MAAVQELSASFEEERISVAIGPEAGGEHAREERESRSRSIRFCKEPNHGVVSENGGSADASEDAFCVGGEWRRESRNGKN